jgi:alpha/beta superfamily hydrolase
MKYQSIVGPAGALQVLEEKTVSEPIAVAVICHPHPLHGGTLTNKVVHQLAKTFSEMGAVSVRFNFRGVGESDGEYDNGRGEVEDLVAVAKWAQQRWQGLPLWLGGFSFGGVIALKGAQRMEPRKLVTVAPAINYIPAESLQSIGADWLLIQGEDDDIVPTVQVKKWIESLEVQPKFGSVAGAGHFFHGRLTALRQVLIDAF